MKVVSVKQVREIEAAVDASIMSYDQMMLNAGRAAATYLLNRLDMSKQTRITLLIGKGNNGGDGLVVAHHLAEKSPAEIRLYLLEPRSEDDRNYQAVVEDGLTIANAQDDHDNRVLKNMINSADVIIDALFGIGINLPLRDHAAKLLRTVKQLLESETASYGDIATLDPTTPNQLPSTPKPFVFAIDCPSGVNCDTGEADTNTIVADETITFIAAKHGLFAFPAAKYVGRLILSQIGIPDNHAELANRSHFVVDNYYVKTHLPARPVDGHKYTFGKAFIVAGCKNYIGATALSGESAYRAGTGLVTIGTTESIIKAIASRLREPTFEYLPDTDGSINESAAAIVIEKSQSYTSLLVGCGLGQHQATQNFIKSLIKHDQFPPLIIDADGLNVLSTIDHWWETLPRETILTPHSGEMARLAQVTTDEINNNRWEIASQKAQEWDVVLVLKGAHTLVAAPDGRIGVIPYKSDALGTAGTGDVLAGLIAGFRAHGISAFDSAVVGAYVHALAGIIAQQQAGNSRSVLARDVLKGISGAFKQVETD